MDVNEIKTLSDVVPYHASIRPDAEAVVYGAQILSFAELERRSNKVAHGLLAECAGSGSRVAILDRNSERFFEVLFGTAKAGNVLVTVNFRLTAPEIEYVLDDSRAEVVFVGEEYAAQVHTIAGNLPGLQRVIVMGEGGAGNYCAWRDPHSAASPAVEVTPADIAVQMYTSGTTGNPKGVELSHGAMVGAALAGLSVWPFLYEPGAAVLGTMPLFHIAAANLCIAALFVGARAEIVRETSPPELARILIEKHITLVPVPATVIHEMLRTPGVREQDFSALKTMLIAGSGISVELLREAQQVFGCGFALSYGSTETCGGMTYLGAQDCTADAGKLLKSAGTLLHESEIRIVDEQGKELPAGQVGEILCRSNRLMTGYWGRPEATRESLRDGWFYSGDAGYMDEDGYLYVVDRIKDMVISGGENIYPTEIEQVMRGHEAVDDVAVVGIPDEKWGEALLAFVIRKPGAGISGEELEAFLRERLAGFKVPRKYEFLDSFPLNATGKVLKRALRAPYWEKEDRQLG